MEGDKEGNILKNKGKKTTGQITKEDIQKDIEKNTLSDILRGTQSLTNKEEVIVRY